MNTKNLLDINQAITDEIKNIGNEPDYEAPTPADGEEAKNYNLDNKGSVVL